MTISEWLGQENVLGMDIFNKKYVFENEDFEAWLDRMAQGNEEIKALIKQKKFLFGGRILANRGLEKVGRKITLSNCYVVAPPEDNIEDIFECAKKLAKTYSYGGGCGVDISRLSPRGARVNNAAKETSGAVSFMDLYATVTSLIGQNGRRGALMISLKCDHPDIEEFINLKTDLNKATKANISVRIDDAFMEAVKNDEDYRLHYTREATGETVEKIVKARKIFRRLAETNWDYAEPGALFWDRIENWNLLSNTDEFHYEGVNPCAEEPLPAGGSCLLGSINLSEFVDNAFLENASFNEESFKACVISSVRAMNEVLDEGLPLHPLLEQQESVRNWRQIGLGIMGLADMLLKLGITYGSEEGAKFCDKVGFIMADTAIKASALLAKEYGAYPKCNIEEVMTTPFFIHNTSEETRKTVAQYGLRNSQILTIAPTGTLSTMLGISGGIEPVYANYYMRKTESLHDKDVYYKVYTKIVEDYMKQHDILDDSDLPAHFVTAMTLGYKDRILMQSAWQKHIDASISSTVNVPNDFTIEDTEDLYTYAHEMGLKGVTLYRDGCRRSGVLIQEPKKKEKEDEAKDTTELKRGEIISIHDQVIGKKRKLMTGCGSLHCIAMFAPKTGALQELYLSKGSTGGCNNFMIGLSRMISISARGGLDIQTIVDQLSSTGTCPSYSVRRATKKDTSKGSCCPMAVGNALLDMYNEVQRELGQGFHQGEVQEVAEDDLLYSQRKHCPECGETLIFEGGCNICKNCGWSKCT